MHIEFWRRNLLETLWFKRPSRLGLCLEHRSSALEARLAEMYYSSHNGAFVGKPDNRATDTSFPCLGANVGSAC